MNKRQYDLLVDLVILMGDLSIQCENDDSFNNFIYDLGVFKGSLDELLLDTIKKVNDKRDLEGLE